jgi:hypothetical protein
MKNIDEENYHKMRRAFIIIRDAGLIIADANSPLSHSQLLDKLGMPQTILNDNPRGVFQNNSILLYQGNFNPLSTENMNLAEKYIPDLIRIFNCPIDVPIYSGVHPGPVGQIWEPMFLVRGRIHD